MNAALVGYKKADVALEESRNYGALESGRHAGRSSTEIVEEGKDAWKSVGVRMKKGGGLDKRCSAYRSKEVTVEDNGRIVGLDEKVRELRSASRGAK